MFFVAIHDLRGCFPLIVTSSPYGHCVFSQTFKRMGHPLMTCHPKSPVPTALRAMCKLLAVSLPFCMAGTHAAAMDQRTTRPAPA